MFQINSILKKSLLAVIYLLVTGGLFAQEDDPQQRYVGIDRGNPDATVLVDPDDWLADDPAIVCLLALNDLVTLTGEADGAWVEIELKCGGKTVTGWVKKAILAKKRTEPNKEVGIGIGVSSTALGAKGSIGYETPDLSGVRDSLPGPWNRLNMLDYRLKPGAGLLKRVPPPRGGAPIWIPIGGGAIVTGGVVYLLTRDKGSAAGPTPLLVQDDQLTVSCGQDVTFNPLLNDQGEGLRITAVTSSSSAQIDWQANGTISLSSLSVIGSITVVISVVDGQGQTAQENAVIQITKLPLHAVDDSFTTDFQTPVSGNVAINDTGTGAMVTDFSLAAGGELSLSAEGSFTFTPLPDFSGLTTFTYTLTDACGQMTMATVSITVGKPACTFSVQIDTTPADCGLDNGTATANVSETGNYTYRWSEGSTGMTISNLAAGSYAVTVTAFGGQCSDSATGQISAREAAYIQSLQTTPGDCTGNGAEIELETTSPGSGPLTVTLNGETVSGIPLGSVSLSTWFELLPGDFSLSLYDSSRGEACSETTNGQIADNSPTPTAAADNYTTPFATPLSGNVLDNDTGLQPRLTEISPVTGGTVAFSPDGSFTFDPLPNFVGQARFTYTLTDACEETATAIVVINVLPPECSFSVSIDTTPADCGLDNGTATANVSETGNYTYRWSEGSTGMTISNLAAGSYAVTVTAFGGQCSDSATGQISAREAAYIQSLQTTPGDCTGNGAEIELETTSPGSGPLTVTLNGETVSGIPLGSVSLSTWFELLPGDFSLSLYDSSRGEACSETTNGQIADNSPTPTAAADNYTTPFATPLSGNVLDNDTGLTLVLTNLFDPVGGTVDFEPNGDFTFLPLPGFVGIGGFTYLATDACGVSVTATVEVLVEAPLCTFTITAIGTDADCGVANGQAEATVDEIGDYEYTWSDGQVGAMIDNLHPDDYQVTATETTTGCSAEATVTIGEINDPYITDLQVIEGNCGEAGDILLTVTTNVSAELRITVTAPDGTVVTFLTAPGTVALSDYLPIIAGDYTITAEDPAQGPACAETTTATVAEAPPGPGLRLLDVMPASSPSAADGALTLLIDPFTVPPFSILLNGEFWGSTTGEVFTIGDLPSGPYTIQVIDESGCGSNLVETFLPFGDGFTYLGTLGGGPILPPAALSRSRIEHPAQDPLFLPFALGTQVSLVRGHQRYQLTLWQLKGPGLSGQQLEFSGQRGWQGKHWGIFNGPVLGYQHLQSNDKHLKATQPFAYWATAVSWRPAANARWSIATQSAIGRQDAWWWRGGLHIKVHW